MLDPVLAPRSQSRLTPASWRNPGPATVVRAVVAIGLVVLVALWSPSYYVTVLAALVLPIVVWRHALAVVVFLAITAREAPAGRGFPSVTTLGAQIFYQGKIPVINFLALSAIAVTFIRLRRERGRLVVTRAAWWLLGCLGALALLAFVMGIVNDQSVFSAANQNSRAFLTGALGVTIGLLIMAYPEEIRAVSIAAVSGLGLLVLVAVYAVATGQAADDRVSRYFIYYDSALPAVASVVFGALLIGRSRLTWPPRVVMGLSLALVLIGFRLTIWGAAFAAVVLAILLGRVWATATRRTAVSAVAVLVFVLVLPGMWSDITTRVNGASSATATASGSTTPSPSVRATASRPAAQPSSARPTASRPAVRSSSPPATGSKKKATGEGGYGVAAESSQGHLHDIRVAWSYVRDNFWTGIGPEHPQLPGLASDETKVLYVHNEWLQDWLRFGPGAVLVVAAFLLIAAVLAVRRLLDRGATTIRRAAAILGLMAPICMLDFPYLSKSNQWPILIGVAAGILAAATTADEAAQTPQASVPVEAGAGIGWAGLRARTRATRARTSETSSR